MTPTQYKKLFDALERDLRNQILIDGMKRLNWKGRLMVFFKRHGEQLLFAACIALLTIVFASRARAETADALKCPTAGEPCKIIYLTAQEEKILMQPGGVLDTASQARALDLGQFVVYFKTRIAGALQGVVVPAQQPEQAKPEQAPKP